MPHDVSTAPDPQGRHAEGWTGIPGPAWREILARTADDFSQKNLSLVAGGATFFLLLAIFPALAAFVALYGLLFDTAAVERQVAALEGFLPPSATELLSGELERLAETSSASLGLAFVAGLLVALWSANAGVKALLSAMNVVWEEREERGFVRLTLVSFAFTLGGLLVVGVLVASVAVVPAVLGAVGLGSAGAWAITILRWPVLLVLIAAAVALLFRYGPSRTPARWRWIVWGAFATTIAIVTVAGAFSFYLANFADYNATYGTLGAVIGLMMWTYLSLLVLLLGAALSAEAEHQVATDTTIGAAKPLGRRGAAMADAVAGRR